jgi:hypothetical protein
VVRRSDEDRLRGDVMKKKWAYRGICYHLCERESTGQRCNSTVRAADGTYFIFVFSSREYSLFERTFGNTAEERKRERKRETERERERGRKRETEREGERERERERKRGRERERERERKRGERRERVRGEQTARE